jgi:alanine racemase
VLPVARTVLANGADALSMASLRDAIALREAGIDVPILVYAGALADRESVELHARWRLVPSLHDEASLAAYEQHAPRRMPVAIKVDVGPERIGAAFSQAADFIQRACRSAKAEVWLVHAHPNVRGGAGELECLQWQHDRLAALRAELEREGIRIPRFALASSKVLRIGGAAMALDAIDPGAALFSCDEEPRAQAFRALRTRLLAVRTVERTQHLEQAPFAMHPGMRVGVLPIGSADGMHRVHAGCVLVRGKRAPIVGQPALEYTRIDLDGVPDAAVGDEVVVIGEQGPATIAPEEACAHQKAARVIDLALGIGPAVVREYVGGAPAPATRPTGS